MERKPGKITERKQENKLFFRHIFYIIALQHIKIRTDQIVLRI
jgi:hypothetical protein